MDNLVPEIRQMYEHCDDFPSSLGMWFKYANDVKKKFLEGDPSQFLQWSDIRRTMVDKNPDWARVELKFLQNHSEWPYLKFAAVDTGFGGMDPHLMKKISSNPDLYGSFSSIHQCYHLARLQYEMCLTLRSEIKGVFEFGGGYGRMAYTLNKLGIDGYVIYDLWQFCLLQKYYLYSHDVNNVLFLDGSYYYGLCKEDWKWVCNLDDKIFIATWSLSEVPVKTRDFVFSPTNRFKVYLIAFQKEFDGVNNLEYFEKLAQRMNGYRWRLFEIEHIPDNFYLFGVRND